MCFTGRRWSVCVCLPLQANMKKFLDYVHAGAVEKLGKALEKGLDPNYHDTESGGETVKAQESPHATFQNTPLAENWL